MSTAGSQLISVHCKQSTSVEVE